MEINKEPDPILYSIDADYGGAILWDESGACTLIGKNELILENVDGFIKDKACEIIMHHLEYHVQRHFEQRVDYDQDRSPEIHFEWSIYYSCLLTTAQMIANICAVPIIVNPSFESEDKINSYLLSISNRGLLCVPQEGIYKLISEYIVLEKIDLIKESIKNLPVEQLMDYVDDTLDQNLGIILVHLQLTESFLLWLDKCATDTSLAKKIFKQKDLLGIDLIDAILFSENYEIIEAIYKNPIWNKGFSLGCENKQWVNNENGIQKWLKQSGLKLKDEKKESTYNPLLASINTIPRSKVYISREQMEETLSFLYEMIPSSLSQDFYITWLHNYLINWSRHQEIISIVEHFFLSKNIGVINIEKVKAIL